MKRVKILLMLLLLLIFVSDWPFTPKMHVFINISNDDCGNYNDYYYDGDDNRNDYEHFNKYDIAMFSKLSYGVKTRYKINSIKIR